MFKFIKSFFVKNVTEPVEIILPLPFPAEFEAVRTRYEIRPYQQTSFIVYMKRLDKNWEVYSYRYGTGTIDHCKAQIESLLRYQYNDWKNDYIQKQRLANGETITWP